MLNSFNDYKRYIKILNHIFDLAWPKWMKWTLKQQYMLSILQGSPTWLHEALDVDRPVVYLDTQQVSRNSSGIHGPWES